LSVMYVAVDSEAHHDKESRRNISMCVLSSWARSAWATGWPYEAC